MTTTVVHVPKVGLAEILSFAEERVNLKPDDVKEERAQVQRLRDRLADHIATNPEFDLVKMIGSGSLAKGTALKTINDVDVAVYVKEDSADVQLHGGARHDAEAPVKPPSQVPSDSQ